MLKPGAWLLALFIVCAGLHTDAFANDKVDWSQYLEPAGSAKKTSTPKSAKSSLKQKAVAKKSAKGKRGKRHARRR